MVDGDGRCAKVVAKLNTAPNPSHLLPAHPISCCLISFQLNIKADRYPGTLSYRRRLTYHAIHAA